MGSEMCIRDSLKGDLFGNPSGSNILSLGFLGNGGFEKRLGIAEMIVSFKKCHSSCKRCSSFNKCLECQSNS